MIHASVAIDYLRSGRFVKNKKFYPVKLFGRNTEAVQDFFNMQELLQGK
jgi:hypothetical protein